MRGLPLALTLLAVEALTQRAHAEEPPFTWQGPDCPEGARVLQLRLTELLEVRDRERLAGRVAVTRNADHYRVELSIDWDGRPLGTRRFEVNSCARAAETAAIAASLAVYDGEGEPRSAPESGSSSAVWTQRPEPTPDVPGPRRPPVKPARPLLHPRLGLLGLVEIGALPQPAWGGSLLLELGIGERWSFGVIGSTTASQQSAVQGARQVRLSSLIGSVRACAAPLRRAGLRLDGCAGMKLEQARGRGEGFDDNRTATLEWAAPVVGANFSVQAPSYIEWRGELDGALPLSRRRFLADGEEVARAGVLVASARLGAVLRF
jgi:hypothetical protein